MDSPFSLLDGHHTHKAVQKVLEHTEDVAVTTHFPAVLGETIEELLIKQVLHTVDQVERLLVNEGYVVGQLVIEAEKLII